MAVANAVAGAGGRTSCLGRHVLFVALASMSLVISSMLIGHFARLFTRITWRLDGARTRVASAFGAAWLLGQEAEAAGDAAAFALTVFLEAGMATALGVAVRRLSREAPTLRRWVGLVAFALPWAWFWYERVAYYPATFGRSWAVHAALTIAVVGGFAFGALRRTAVTR